MKQQHTPGPWIVAEDRFIRNIEDQLIAEVQEWHQFVTQCKDGTLDMDQDEMPWKANARLMAAAPELLNALRELYEAGLTFDRIPYYKALRIAKELIEKIEGDEGED